MTFTPLTDNLLKLCQGLRSSGFEKQAQELESNFLSFKQAQTLYQAHKETGEDLVHSAHPEGSHKLVDVEGKEATVEDILDKHLAFMGVVNKKPTGKLSSNQLIHQVKTVLAQAAISEMTSEQLESAINNSMRIINSAVARINSLSSNKVSRHQKTIQELSQTPDIDHIKQIQSQLEGMINWLDPNSWTHRLSLTSGVSEDTWAGIQDLLEKAKTATNNALSYRTQLKTLQSKQEVTPSGSVQVGDIKFSEPDPKAQKVNSLIDKLKAYTSIGPIARSPVAMKWINQETSELRDLANRISNVPPGQEKIVAPGLEREVAEYEDQVNDFANKWKLTA